MNHSDIETFYLCKKLRIPMATLVFLVFVFFAFTSVTQKIDNNLYLLYFFMGVFNAFAILAGTVIKLHSSEIQMYAVNKLKYSDIKEVKEKKLLGLPYLLVAKKKGPPWWLPLYYTGNRPLLEGLKEKLELAEDL